MNWFARLSLTTRAVLGVVTLIVLVGLVFGIRLISVPGATAFAFVLRIGGETLHLD